VPRHNIGHNIGLPQLVQKGCHGASNRVLLRRRFALRLRLFPIRTACAIPTMHAQTTLSERTWETNGKRKQRREQRCNLRQRDAQAFLLFGLALGLELGLRRWLEQGLAQRLELRVRLLRRLGGVRQALSKVRLQRPCSPARTNTPRVSTSMLPSAAHTGSLEHLWWHA
jgi:hypothetical protein